MWKDFTRMTTEIWKRYKVDLLSKILEAFADQCCPARPVWLYMLQRVRCVWAAAVGYKHRAENIINQTTTVKQELRADITSKHLRCEAIQIDEVWSQSKTADIPDRSQMHEWKDCEIWSFQRYVCVLWYECQCCSARPSYRGGKEWRWAEEKEVVYMYVSIPSASAHTGTEKTLTDTHYQHYPILW